VCCLLLGAVLHWIHYLPHYKTLPEPAATDKEDNLLRRRDTMKESALQIASYATRPDRKVCGAVRGLGAANRPSGWFLTKYRTGR